MFVAVVEFYPHDFYTKRTFRVTAVIFDKFYAITENPSLVLICLNDDSSKTGVFAAENFVLTFKLFTLVVRELQQYASAL